MFQSDMAKGQALPIGDYMTLDKSLIPPGFRGVKNFKCRHRLVLNINDLPLLTLID